MGNLRSRVAGVLSGSLMLPSHAFGRATACSPRAGRAINRLHSSSQSASQCAARSRRGGVLSQCHVEVPRSRVQHFIALRQRGLQFDHQITGRAPGAPGKAHRPRSTCVRGRRRARQKTVRTPAGWGMRRGPPINIPERTDRPPEDEVPALTAKKRVGGQANAQAQVAAQMAAVGMRCSSPARRSRRRRSGPAGSAPAASAADFFPAAGAAAAGLGVAVAAAVAFGAADQAICATVIPEPRQGVAQPADAELEPAAVAQAARLGCARKRIA